MTPKLQAIFKDGYDKIARGELKTFIPYLCLFKVNNAPMSLKLHYQFMPMFNTVQAPNTVWMFGRQLGKSYQLCGSSQIRSSLIPNYHQLVIQPRSDQIQRLNSTVYQPLMRSCPLKNDFITSTELAKMALKAYNNGSLVYMDHIFQSPDRVRGVSGAAACLIDECQDIEYEFINIVKETMSASLNWGFAIYTGTPKTTDTTLALLWDRSSQAEWVIHCTHCGHYNVPNPEHDLLKMIGKQGPICAKCGKDVTPKNGQYIHAVPERMHVFPGYHVSQTIHPLHIIPSKWVGLLSKVESYPEKDLYNEVLGWPYDAATSPLTMSDLQKSTFKPMTWDGQYVDIQKPSDVLKVQDKYEYITVGVDWSGGGMISDSYTSYAVVGMRPGGQVLDVLYGKRIPKGRTPTEEAQEIMSWIRGTKADAFTYDNGGAGFVRLEIMKHAGLHNCGNLAIVPISYTGPRSGDIMQLHHAIRELDMYYYSMDKTRSLAVCVAAIKAGRIRFREFDETDEKAYQRDFLALREDIHKARGNETVIIIIKKPGVPDDFAHAVNFACSQIWDHFRAYPRIGQRYDASILDYDDNHNPVQWRGVEEEDPDFLSGPRSDFNRFVDALKNTRPTVIQPNTEY